MFDFLKRESESLSSLVLALTSVITRMLIVSVGRVS